MSVLLLQAGYEVIILDNLSNSKQEVLVWIEKITNKKPIFYNQDITDIQWIKRIFEKHAIDGVIHFAALKAVGESMSHPFEYYENNIVGTLNLLKVMDEYKVRNLVFSSSCTVYGDSKTQPLSESSPKQPCASPYGWTKSINEDLLMGLCQSTDLKVCALRYFNPIGAHPSGLIGEEPNGVPSNLLPYVMKTTMGEYEYLNVFWNDYNTPDGTAVRDYIHVMDLVQAHLQALDWIIKQKFWTFDVFNLGTGVGISVLEVIAATEKVTGKKIPYKILDRRAGDVEIAYANPTKAKDVLWWESVLTLEDAIRDMRKFENMRKSS